MYFHIVNQITMLRQVSKLLLVCILCTSCDYFSSQKSASNSNFQVLDTVIDYTSVDVYPIFSDCENYSENDNQKECFEASITQKLSELLSRNELRVDHEVHDKTSIDILIDQTGKASLIHVNSPQSILKELPGLEQMIRESVNGLPTMKPAIKRNMFVKSQYRMELIIEMI